MKKNIIALLITVIMLSITACGKQETIEATTEFIPTTAESEQADTAVADEIVATDDAVDTAYANSMFVTASEGIAEAANSEGLTAGEEMSSDYDYMDKLVENYEGDIFTKYDAYVKDQGADAYEGAWLIYYYGSAAGNQRSYAINQRTGEKIVAGPYTYFYGSSEEDDSSEPFWGTDKIYPGDKYPEFEQNMRLAIGEDPAYLYE